MVFSFVAGVVVGVVYHAYLNQYVVKFLALFKSE